MTELNAQTSAEKHASGASDTSRLYHSLAEKFTRTMLDEMGARVTCVVLYGSVARSTAQSESDIDLFVVAGETEKDKDEVWDRILDLEQSFWDNPEIAALRARGYRASIETYVVSKPQARRGLAIYLDMAIEAVILHDPEGFFARRIEQVRQRMIALNSRREWLDGSTYVWQLKAEARPGEAIALPYIEEAA